MRRGPIDSREDLTYRARMSMLCFLAALIPAIAPVTPLPEKSPADTRRTVLVLDLKANGVDAATVNTLTEIVAQAVSRDRNLAVTSGADLRALVKLEEQKQAFGCDESSCLADLAGALGADLIVSGSVGQLGTLQVVSLTLYDAAKQTAIAREKVQAESSSMGSLSAAIDATIDRMFGRTSALAAVVAPTSPDDSGDTSTLVVIGGIVAGVGVVAAGVGGGFAAYSARVQGDKNSSGADKEKAASRMTPALIAAGAGGAVIIVGVALLTVGLLSE
jgi:hypothetical protein